MVLLLSHQKKKIGRRKIKQVNWTSSNFKTFGYQKILSRKGNDNL